MILKLVAKVGLNYRFIDIRNWQIARSAFLRTVPIVVSDEICHAIRLWMAGTRPGLKHVEGSAMIQLEVDHGGVL